ncbi:response regulator [Phormidesmis sp. 146-12]
MRILLVDDDEVVVQQLSKVLIDHRYVVDVAVDGLAGWDLVDTCDYDVIVLDVQLPRLNGIEFCKRLRSHRKSTPVLLMTAQSASGHKVIGLDAGADDYLVKPVDLPELLARIRALLRRRDSETRLPALKWGSLQLDLNSRAVTCADRALRLTPKEYKLLEIFLQNPQRIFSSSALIDQLWSFDEEAPTEDTVRSHLKGLRKKLKAAGLEQDPVETVYGIGYRLKPSPKPDQTTDDSTFNNPKKNAKKSKKPSAPEPTEVVAAEIQQIWQQTREKLQQRFATIEATVTLLAKQQSSVKQQKEACQEAHKLAGSLGMFGTMDGSELASEIEQLLDGKHPPKSDKLKSLKPLVQKLRQEIEQLDRQYQAGDRGLVSLDNPTVDNGYLPPADHSTEARLMLVDDDPLILQTLKEWLMPWGFEIHTLSQPEQFADTLKKIVPDLLVLDIEMPGISGIDLCLQLRNDPAWSSLPVLFLTARRDAETIQRVFTAGADDYISKPIVGPEFVIRILNRLERSRLLRALADTDSLTGLANRRKATHELVRLLALAKRQDKPVSIALLDLDYFKQINEIYGHPTGDRILHELGAILQQSFRLEDVLGRWGGEEFVVAMYDVARSSAVERLQNLLNQLRAHPFDSTQGSPVCVTFSTGIVQYPQDGADWQALYQVADQRLRQAKLAGRNQVLSGQRDENRGRKDQENGPLE